VYQATLDGRAVAVKILRKSDKVREVTARPKHHPDFFREIKIWRSISDSPHVMRLVGYYFDSPSEEIGFVSCMAEDDLRNWAKNCTERKYDTLRLKYLVGAAKGVHHLHQANVVHGDLRASNILLVAGVAKVTDFGISKLDGNPSSFSMAKEIDKLVKHWLAPELIDCADASRTKSSDLFAFARMIVEVYTGDVPFSGEMIADLIGHICKFRHPVRPQGIGDAVWKIMEQYWAKDPNDRGTAEDIIQCIGDVDAGDVVTNGFGEEPDDDIFPIGS